MADKTFYLNRDGATPQIIPANDDLKLKVYDNIQDVDTSNLNDGEIISTKEGVDAGNIYDYIKQVLSQNIDLGPDYENGVTTTVQTGSGGFNTVTYTATEDCYLVARHWTEGMGSTQQAVNYRIILTTPNAGVIGGAMYQGYGGGVYSEPVKLYKGNVVSIHFDGYSNRGYYQNYTVYPVKHPTL